MDPCTQPTGIFLVNICGPVDHRVNKDIGPMIRPMSPSFVCKYNFSPVERVPHPFYMDLSLSNIIWNPYVSMIPLSVYV